MGGLVYRDGFDEWCNGMLDGERGMCGLRTATLIPGGCWSGMVSYVMIAVYDHLFKEWIIGPQTYIQFL